MRATHVPTFLKKIVLAAVLFAAWCAVCQANTLVGTLPGEFSVDNKGSANYTIPLQIPPGRSGMQPRLALHYNSNAGNGPLGIGFSLSTGFPQSITRGRSILARDGVVRGVKFDSQDKLYLDGKLLICTGGTYGMPNSVYRTEVDSFATITAYGTGDNIEGFRMIPKDGTTLCFGKNTGIDSGDDGYHMLGGETTGRAYAWALKWVEDTVGNYIEFRYDETGADGFTLGEGEHVLTSMRYTGNRSEPAASPQFMVSLRYNEPSNLSGISSSNPRPDGGLAYRYGRKTVMNSRLDRIIVHESSKQPDSSPIRVYSLKYKTSAAHAPLKLESVGLADYSAGTTAMRSTELTWGAPPGQLGEVKSLDSWLSTLPKFIGDFNGDGRKDVLGRKATNAPVDGSIFGVITNTHLISGNEGKTFAETPIAMPDEFVSMNNDYLNLNTHVRSWIYSSGDINGDGKTDLIFKVHDGRTNPNPNKGGWYVSLATGSGFAPAERVINDGVLNVSVVNGPEIITDIDGDGLDDLIYSKEKVMIFPSFPDYGGGDGGRDEDESATALMHFLGITFEHVMIPGGAFHVKSPVVSSGSLGYKPEYSIPTPTKLRNSTAYVPMDLNGDGLTDFLATEMAFDRIADSGDALGPYYAKSCKLWSVINTGSKTLEARPIGGGETYLNRYGVALKLWNWRERYYQTDPDPSSPPGASTYMIGDVNGDGLDDIVFFRLRVKMDRLVDEPEPINGWTVYLSKGDGTFDEESFSAPPLTVTVGSGTVVPTYNQRPGYTDGRFEGFDIRATLLIDYNGDGKKDLVWYTEQGGWRCLLATRSGFDANNPIAIQSPEAASFDYNKTNIYIFGSFFGYLAQATDLDGDGRDDILLLQSTSPSSYPLTKSVSCIFAPSSDANRLVAVKDGLGVQTHIQYTPVTRDRVYTPGAPVSYPIREDRRPQHVVSDVYKDSGSDNSADRAHFSYQYSGNRLDLSGRGPLGFHSFVTLDHQTNLFKYQFLTQSFPMTGLTMREQTYRFWEDGSNVRFRLISSHDNTVVFDEVANPAGGAPWGTVYPFISSAVESRWEDANTAHYTFASVAASSQPETIFTQIKPGGAHITITAESRFDNQSSVQTTVPGSYKPGDFDSNSRSNVVTGYPDYSTFHNLPFPRKITYGNLVELKTDFGDGFTEKVTTTYKSPAGALTGLIDTVATTVTSSYGTETAPVKSYTYWSGSTPTPLVKTETTTASDSALGTTITYSRDSLGRVTVTTLSGYDNTSDPRHIGSYATSKAAAFDSRFDLPTIAQNAYDHSTTTTYHSTFGLPTSITDVNGAQTTTTYDALGRVVRTRNELLGLQTDTTYAWTESSASDWQQTQTVTPPAGLAGALTLSSVFAIRTAATAQPAVTTYHDRLGRPIRVIKEGFNGQHVITDTIYNNLGQTVATSLPYPSGGAPLWTKTTYDPLGRVATITAPNGTVTTNIYAGRATAVTVDAPDREPQTNVTLVDPKGRTVKVWNADNVPDLASLNPITGSALTASIEYKLDGFGRMRQTILKGQALPIETDYDALGRQTSLEDPDKGKWTYLNNALGQVVQQIDAKGNTTLSTFDRLARPLTRSTAEPAKGAFETALWYYFDESADPARHLVAKGSKGWIGSPQREEYTTTGAPGYAATMPSTTTTWYYDAKGRVETTLRGIDGKWFYTNTAYDHYSRVSQLTHHWRHANNESGLRDPYLWDSFGYSYTYDAGSYLLKLTDTTPQARVWWEADSSSGYDHLDRPVLVRKGDAHWTRRDYRTEDGVLTSIKTGPNPGDTAIQNLSYDFDRLGNLTSRSDGRHSETFDYDILNRLTTRNGSAIATYAANGNITSKVDVLGNGSGDYTYGPAKQPHAVLSAWGYSMTYDANGNLATRTGHGDTWTMQWTGFDKPRWLARSSSATTIGSEFLYNANRSRIMHLEFDQMAAGAPSHYTRKKIYAAGPDVEIDYKNAAATGLPDWKRDTVRVYVNAPDGMVGTAEFTSTSSPDLNPPTLAKALVYHTDHLGSIESITAWGDTTASLASDDTGKPSLYSYDPWGERRNPLTWVGKPVTTDAGGPDGTASRGFTGHEMMDRLGLVHMNGRIYDPLIGRMLSADPIVQFSGNLQSYNRYSYVYNSPLSNTDPSGHIIVAAVPLAGILLAGGGVTILVAGGYAISTPQGKEASIATTRAGGEVLSKIGDGAKGVAVLGLGAVAQITSAPIVFDDPYVTYHARMAEVSQKSTDQTSTTTANGDAASNQTKQSADQAGGSSPAADGVADAAPKTPNASQTGAVDSQAPATDTSTQAAPNANTLNNTGSDATADSGDEAEHKPTPREQSRENLDPKMGGEDNDPDKGKKKPPKDSKEHDRQKQDRHDQKRLDGRRGADNVDEFEEW